MLKIFLISKLRERGREDLERIDPEKIGREDQETTMKTDPQEEIIRTGHPEGIVKIDHPEGIGKIDPQGQNMRTDLQEETDKMMKDLPEEISRIETGRKEDHRSAGLK